MASHLLKENGLNVEYVSRFFETQDADAYLLQLKELPFYQPTLNIRGKSVKPKRLVLAYGDDGLSYSFSGTEIAAEPWTPLMIELRDRVEKHVGCTFNYVLLNLYADGSSYIAHHKDNEPGLDITFPISVLSFGVERTIEFKKADSTTSLKLEHGSLYTMQRPTNKLFTHGIAMDPEVKSLRISLTFRHLLPSIVFPLMKKPRLELKDTPEDTLKKDSSNEVSKDCDELSQNDWLVNFFKQDGNTSPVLAEWSLNWTTFLQIVLDQKCQLRVHIRAFKETASGTLHATKKGITMTPKTWDHFRTSIEHLKFESVHESFVSNNQLLVACMSETFCVLQQMFPLNSEGFFLKPSVLKLSPDQIGKVCDSSFEITECIIKALISVQIPKLLQNTSSVCFNHLKDVENAKKFLFKCIAHEVDVCANALFRCSGCELNSNAQSSHDCLKKTTHEKFELNRQSIFLHLNLNSIISQVKNECLCFFSPQNFCKFSMHEVENFISNTLTLNSKKGL